MTNQVNFPSKVVPNEGGGHRFHHEWQTIITIRRLSARTNLGVALLREPTSVGGFSKWRIDPKQPKASPLYGWLELRPVDWWLY